MEERLPLPTISPFLMMSKTWIEKKTTCSTLSKHQQQYTVQAHNANNSIGI